jgi:hypothetical protein
VNVDIDEHMPVPVDLRAAASNAGGAEHQRHQRRP